MLSLKGILTAGACVLIAGTYILASYDFFEPAPPAFDPDITLSFRSLEMLKAVAKGSGTYVVAGRADMSGQDLSDPEVVGSTLRMKPLDQASNSAAGEPALDAFGLLSSTAPKPAAPVEYPTAIFD